MGEHEALKTAPGQSVLSFSLGRTPAGGNGVLPKRLSACIEMRLLRSLQLGSMRDVAQCRPRLLMHCAIVCDVSARHEKGIDAATHECCRVDCVGIAGTGRGAARSAEVRSPRIGPRPRGHNVCRNK